MSSPDVVCIYTTCSPLGGVLQAPRWYGSYPEALTGAFAGLVLAVGRGLIPLFGKLRSYVSFRWFGWLRVD